MRAISSRRCSGSIVATRVAIFSPPSPVGPLEMLEGLEQLRFLENGRQVLCVEVNAKGRQFWELNNPSDVPVIEAMMAAMG